MVAVAAGLAAGYAEREFAKRGGKMVFDYVQLWTAELPRVTAFYRDMLGVPLLSARKNAVTFQVGTTQLEFRQGVGGLHYHLAFNVPPQQFAEARAWLTARTPLIQDSSGRDTFHSESWNADMVYFYDAVGNVLELIARYDLRGDTPQPFSGRSLACVSELGVVTRDVPQTVRRIQALTGAPLYRAEMDEQFVPLGDARGLLIVVKVGRLWFPETKAAVMAPFRVRLSSVGKRLELTEANVM